MATTQPRDGFLSNEAPPPAYELSQTELDRKLADATQRSLALHEEQLQRPALPPVDEEGFPAWSDELFKYNELLRQREEEVHSAKLRSEYTRASAPASGPSASCSTSPPPSRALLVPGFGDPNLKQKEDRLGWFDESAAAGGIQQDDDEPEAGPLPSPLNVGSHPYTPPRTQNQTHSRPVVQVHVGPRPHDLLAQPQSPVSDVDEDNPLSGPDATSSLGRAPTYYPVGQVHPGHRRLQRQDTRGSMDSVRSELPAWSALAPNLEGPAYEEVVQGSGSGRRTSQGSSRVVSPSARGGRSTSPEERRRTAGDYRPIQARPPVQERVGRSATQTASAPNGPVLHSPLSPQSRGPGGGAAANANVNAPVSTHPNMPTIAPRTTWDGSSATVQFGQVTRSPSSYAPPQSLSYVPAGYPGGRGFDPGVAYRASQKYTLNGRVDLGTGSIVEAQNALKENGASAFYPTAVAATMRNAPVFTAPGPPPPPVQVNAEDNVSILSGRSNGRQSSINGGDAEARMSMHISREAALNRMSYVPPQPASGQPYQPPAIQRGALYAPGPGAFIAPPPPPPLPLGVQPPYVPGVNPAYALPGRPMGGGSRPLPAAPTLGAPIPNGPTYAPPPPPGVPPPMPDGLGGPAQPPGRRPGKLYKHL